MASRSEAFHPLPPVPPAVFWSVMGGTAAAMLDLAVAAAYWGARGVAPDRIFQSIAAWLLGPAAFTGGESTVALGAVLYAGVLSGVMGVYRLLARRLPVLLRHPFYRGRGVWRVDVRADLPGVRAALQRGHARRARVAVACGLRGGVRVAGWHSRRAAGAHPGALTAVRGAPGFRPGRAPVRHRPACRARARSVRTARRPARASRCWRRPSRRP